MRLEGQVLSAESVSFSYAHTRSAFIITEFSHDFAPGSLTLLTGASGRGKSTLLYVLAGMLRPQSGTVRHGDVLVSSGLDAVRSAWRARSAGFVFQDSVLDPSRPVLDNIVEPAVYAGRRRRAAEDTAHQLLERFGVSLRAQAPPAQISGGQAQRVALCRALVNDPEVLFADEPTGNLDRATARLVWEALSERAAQGTTVLVATHQSPGDIDATVVEL